MVTWQYESANLTGVAIDLLPITPDDDADIVLPEGVTIQGLRIGATGGTLRFTSLRDEVRNTNVVAGERLEVAYVKRVHATGTTATPIEAYLG